MRRDQGPKGMQDMASAQGEPCHLMFFKARWQMRQSEANVDWEGADKATKPQGFLILPFILSLLDKHSHLDVVNYPKPIGLQASSSASSHRQMTKITTLTNLGSSLYLQNVITAKDMDLTMLCPHNCFCDGDNPCCRRTSGITNHCRGHRYDADFGVLQKGKSAAAPSSVSEQSISSLAVRTATFLLNRT
jgi:hypothetical protein